MITTIWSGLTTGGIYGVVAIAYAITLAATGTFNFAQAQLVTVGIYVTYVFSTEDHLPGLVVVVIAAAITAAVAFLQERTIIRYIRDAPPTVTLVVTLGIAVAIDGIALAIWGSNANSVSLPGGDRALSVAGGRVDLSGLILIGAVLVLTVALWLLERFTRVGIAMRATAADRVAASLRGVNVNRVGTYSFVAAGAIVGLLAAPIGAQTLAVYSVADNLVTFAFVALTLGSFRNYPGIACGALLVGVIQALASRYLSSDWSMIVVFLLFLLFLLARPGGIGVLDQRRLV